VGATYAPTGHTGVIADGLFVAGVTGGNLNNICIEVGTPSGASGLNVGIRLFGGAPALQIDAGGLTVTAGITLAAGGLVIAGSQPSVTAGQLGFGGAFAAPNGASNTLSGPIKGTGTGPNSLAVNTWIPVNAGGTTLWIPAMF